MTARCRSDSAGSEGRKISAALWRPMISGLIPSSSAFTQAEASIPSTLATSRASPGSLWAPRIRRMAA
jgi:hypothetical protein